MNKIQLIVILTFLIGFSTQVKSQEESAKQDTLWYLNGDSELISNYQFVEEGKVLNYTNHKGKYKDIEVFYLFSINKADGSKSILYKPAIGDDENKADTLTVEEMEAFMIGGFLAKKNYKARGALAEGFVVGVASPLLVSYLSINPFYALLIPAANSAVIGITRPSDQKIREKYPELSKNELFVEGYKEAAKTKRTKHSIIGGLVGLVVGFTTVFLL